MTKILITAVYWFRLVNCYPSG